MNAKKARKVAAEKLPTLQEMEGLRAEVRRLREADAVIRAMVHHFGGTVKLTQKDFVECPRGLRSGSRTEEGLNVLVLQVYDPAAERVAAAKAREATPAPAPAPLPAPDAPPAEPTPCPDCACATDAGAPCEGATGGRECPQDGSIVEVMGEAECPECEPGNANPDCTICGGSGTLPILDIKDEAQSPVAGA